MSFHRFISSFLHPIIFPLLGSVFYLFVLPRFISNERKIIILLLVFIGTYLLPVFLLYVLKQLKMISSFHLPSIEERKFPLLLFTFLATLIGRLLFKLALINDLAIYFIAGGFALLLVYFFLWMRLKVSIHTMGVGGLIGFILQLSLSYEQNYLPVTAFLFMLFGVIANARLQLRAHTFKEVILGLIIGFIPQLLVPYIYQNI